MAQVHALGRQRGPARAVWLPSATFDRLEPRRASELRRVIDDYDLHLADLSDRDGGEGGHLLARDKATTERALARHGRGVPVRDIVAELAGAGRVAEAGGMRASEAAPQGPPVTNAPAASNPRELLRWQRREERELATRRRRYGRLEKRARRKAALNPAFEARVPEFVAALERDPRRMLPSDVALRLLPRMTYRGHDLLGKWGPADRVVSLALSQGTRVAKIKGFHEVQHVLRKLYTNAEWKVLLDKAREANAEANSPSVKGVPGIEVYRRMYTKRAREMGMQGRAPQKRTEELLDQERVAALAEMWAEGRDFGKKVNALLKRILEFLQAIGSCRRASRTCRIGWPTAVVSRTCSKGWGRSLSGIRVHPPS